MIQIHNTMTRKKEVFEPIDSEQVRIYCCGPTVYDRFHIGNARPFIFMDVVRRYFEYCGYKVRFVQNITDIDDKIIKRAHDENLDWTEIARRYTAHYLEDSKKLRVRPADVNPKATEHIDDMIEFIGRLVDKGLAYAAEGSVYFSVGDWKPYGKLSGRNTEDMLEGARVEVNAAKRDPRDFVLWKASKPGEPVWSSPWGEGRPGWHIECSVMAIKHLGETIDIHAGGSDLIFPHHENEVAQSEGATGKPFARYWMHNGFLNIDSEKMSKSLGNLIRIDQMLERASAAVVRHFLLGAHYRHPLDLTEEAIEESNAAIRRINDSLHTGEALLALEGDSDRASATAEVQALRKQFEAAMDDDFNTPRAMAVLFEVVGLIHETRKSQPPDLDRLASLVAFGRELCEFFGFEDEKAESGGKASDALIDDLMALLIDTRQAARKQKAFELADMIRDRLGEIGIAIEDHPQGTIWKRENK